MVNSVFCKIYLMCFIKEMKSGLNSSYLDMINWKSVNINKHLWTHCIANKAELLSAQLKEIYLKISLLYFLLKYLFWL